MKSALLATILLACIAAPCLCMQSSWANWILPNWTPDWSYNSSWQPQNTSAFNFYRTNYTSSSAPGYTTRSNHYLYVSTASSPYTYALACGPETYLRSDLLCERKPLYWNTVITGTVCQPDTVFNGVRYTC